MASWEPVRGFREIVLVRTGFDFCHLLEIGCGDFVGLQREAEIREALERNGQMIDCVVQDRQRTVAAFVVNLEAEVDDVLFADLNVVRDFLAIERFAPAAFVQRIFGIDQLAMILQEPVGCRCTGRRLLRRR